MDLSERNESKNFQWNFFLCIFLKFLWIYYNMRTAHKFEFLFLILFVLALYSPYTVRISSPLMASNGSNFWNPLVAIWHCTRYIPGEMDYLGLYLGEPGQKYLPPSGIVPSITLGRWVSSGTSDNWGNGPAICGGITMSSIVNTGKNINTKHLRGIYFGHCSLVFLSSLSFFML